MTWCVLSYGLSFSTLLPVAAAAESKGNTGAEPTNIDFNGNGVVDEDDLISFLQHRGTIKGMGNYRVLYDLNRDDRINHDDLIILMDAWKEQVTPVPPMTISEVLTLTGYDDLEQNTWMFGCLDGAAPDCTGEARTMAEGPHTEIDGKQAVSIIWGSATGEPLDTLYFSRDAGPVSLLQIEKNADSSRKLFGFNVPPQTVEMSGIPTGTASGMVEFGKEVVSSGTGSIKTSLKLGPITGEPVIEGDWTTSITAVALPSGSKGLTAGDPIIVMGDGTVDHTMGQTRATWELVYNDQGIQFINYCWTVDGEEQCRSYDRIPDPGPTPTPVPGACIAEVEPNDAQFTSTFVQLGNCGMGTVTAGSDDVDFFRTSVFPQGEFVVECEFQSSGGAEGFLTLFLNDAGSGPAEDLIGSDTVSVPITTVSPGDLVYARVLIDGSVSPPGSSISYEIRTQLSK